MGWNTRAFFKPLSENDNSKNQIYLGSNFKVLQQLPFGEIKEFPDNQKPNYKARMNFYWINEWGNVSQAPGTQLILYARYPEVRLSGFLNNCPTAPGMYMQEKKRTDRESNNEKDGRVLVFGICSDNRVYGYLAPKNSVLADSILHKLFDEQARKTLQPFPLEGAFYADKISLIGKLRNIILHGWHESIKLDTYGNIQKYNAINGGGYTLEALFGIIPNGKSEPDFKGWELKAFSGNRITLMTPEPDQGFYHERGAKEFVLKYGHNTSNSIKYFTGTHKADVLNAASKMTLTIKGFDCQKGVITDMKGGVFLLDANYNTTAIWSFSQLLKRWSKKHSHTCYVKYKKIDKNDTVGYVYHSPVYLGEGTDFSLFLKALQSGYILYDPGVKVTQNPNGNTAIKARSQFRINFKDLPCLYENFYEEMV